MDAAYDWGLHQPADPVAARTMNEDADGLEPEQLPEVRERTAQGEELAPDAPMLVFLPAVWPRALRTWVPDRASRHEASYEQDPRTSVVLHEQTVRSSSESRDENDNDALLFGTVVHVPRGQVAKRCRQVGDERATLPGLVRRESRRGHRHRCRWCRLGSGLVEGGLGRCDPAALG